MDGPSVAGGQARQPPTSAYSASDPSRPVSSDVALCPTGKDNDGFNEGPLNHVTVDLANKKKKNGHADGPAVMHANTKLRAAASVLIFTFNESGNQVRVSLLWFAAAAAAGVQSFSPQP